MLTIFAVGLHLYPTGLQLNKYVIKKNIFCVQEFLKLTVDLADLVGIYFVMQRVAGKGQVKVSCSWFEVFCIARYQHLIILL